ncbi:MAG TPA: hypothetical protein VKP69_27575 [Isosphaeraceae bacterium]|nr:hypothetical protein [Isosphaeraceae bacterium]
MKTVPSSVWPTHNQVFSVASVHEVSSMWAEGASATAASNSATTGSSISAARRSSF